MAGVLKYLNVQLRLQVDDFNKGVRQAQREAAELQKTLKPTATILSDLGKTAKSAGVVLSAALTAPIAAVAGLGLSFNAMQEQAQVAFTTMLGDGKKAATFLSDLKDFAATTPFEFPDLVAASQRLMAMGFEAKKVRPILESVGDAAAGMGKGSDAIFSMTKALSDMQAKGKVSTQELNQLAEVGINAGQILADAMGKSRAAFQDLVEKGAVPAGKSIEIILDSMNKQFGGMMAKQSQTFSGLISTIKDESRFLAGELTEGLFNALKGPLSQLASFLHDIRMRMDGLSDSTKATILVLGGIAAAAGPALFIFGQLAQSLSAILLIAPKVAAALKSVVVLTGVAEAASLLSMVRSYRDLGAALSLIAETSIVAKAGLVGVAIAVGYGIGMIANYALEVSGLQSEFDRLLKKVADLTLPGKMLTGQQDLEESTRALSKAQERLVSDLEKRNIAVDKARLGDSAYMASLSKLLVEELKRTGQYKESAKQIDDVGKKTDKLILTLLDEAKATNKAAAARKEWVKAMDDAGTDYAASMGRMKQASFDFYRELEESRKADVKSGEDANDKIAKDTIETFGKVQRARQLFSDLMLIVDQANAMESSRANAEAYDNIQLQVEAAIDLEKRQAKESKNAAETFRQAWATAVGNIASRFSDTIADMIVDWDFGWKGMLDILKDTAKSMLSAFISGFITPMLSQAAGLGGKLAESIFGGGKGGGGILGSVLGGGSGGSGGGGGGGSQPGGLAGALSMAGSVGNILGGVDTVAGWIRSIGAGRRAADEIVKSQNAMWAAIVGLYEGRDTSSPRSLARTRASIDEVFGDWQEAVRAFAASDPNNQKVANQAFAELIPTITRLRADLDKELEAAGGMPGEAGGGVTLNQTVNVVFNVDGQDLNAQVVREQIMPEITTALETGVRSFREVWTRILGGNNGLSSTSVG